MATMKKTSAAPPSPIERILIIETEHGAKDDKSVISYTCKNGEEIKLEVAPVLTFEEMYKFISTVVESVFVKETYVPLLKKFVSNNMIIKFYLKSELNIDDDDAVTLAYKSNLVDEIIKAINPKQFSNICDVIDRGIEFKKQEILSVERNLLNKSISECEKLAAEAAKYIESFNKIAELYKEIDIKEVLDTFKKISDKSNQDFVNNVLDYNRKD